MSQTGISEKIMSKSRAELISIPRQIFRLLIMILCVFFHHGCKSYFLISDSNWNSLHSMLKKDITIKKDNRKKMVFLGFLTFVLPGAIVLPPSFAKDVCYFKKTKYINLKCLPDDSVCKSTVGIWSQEKKYANFFQISKNHNVCAISGFATIWADSFFREFRKGKADPTSIDPADKKFRKFADLYFNEYGNQSVYGFAETFQLTDEGKILNLQSDVDYYVIGKFLPVERELSWLGYLTYSSTIIPYVLTLGMIPSVEHNKITPSYYIFDKNFNQVASYHYRSEYWLVSTIWELDPKYPAEPDA